MVMYTNTIEDGNDLRTAFADYEREGSFTSEGYDALFDMLQASGVYGKLDVIAIDCEYAQYDSCIDAADGYDVDYSSCDDDDGRESCAMDYLKHNTMLLMFDGGVITAVF